jgi:hypothetical protein
VKADDAAVLALEQLAQGTVLDNLDGARDAAKIAARPAGVAERQAALEAERAFGVKADAELGPIEREELAAIAALEEVHGRRQAALQRKEAGLGQLRRGVERVERALSAAKAVPAAVRELDDEHHELVSLTWENPGLPSWPTAARAAWLDDLGAAGRALGELKLSLCTPAEIARVRALLDALTPGQWASKHADICRPEPVAAGVRGF